MYRKTIAITPDTPNFPLPPIWVGQGSAAIVIVSNLPAGTIPALILTPMSGGGTPTAYPAVLNSSTGLYEIYIAGWAFPVVGNGAKYEITLTTGTAPDAVVYWAGQGLYSVWVASTVAEIPNAPAIPGDRYMYVPSDGKYHLVSGDLDPVTGLFTFAMGQEGYTAVPEGGIAI